MDVAPSDEHSGEAGKSINKCIKEACRCRHRGRGLGDHSHDRRSKVDQSNDEKEDECQASNSGAARKQQKREW